jgi:hypothetical protein
MRRVVMGSVALLWPVWAGAACEVATGIVINEFLPDPSGTDTGLEWIEIYNASGSAVDLEGWRIQAGTSSWGNKVTFAAGTTLAAGGYLLVGEALVPDTDVTAALTLGNATSNSDAVRLLDCENNVADTVVYGTPNEGEGTDNWEDDTGLIATSLAPKPFSGQSLARKVDGLDTNRSGDDFVSNATLTPGAPNPAPPACDPGGDLVINEFDPLTTGAEWVELYNRSGTAVNLEGWQVQAGTSSFGTKVAFGGVTIPAGGYLVVGEAGASGVDVAATLAMGNATNNADAVRLVDCAGTPIDTVVYGTPNSDEWTDDTGEIATSLAPKPASGHSLARRPNGADTDASGDDFVLTSSKSPGAANPAPPACSPAAGIVINELLPDPTGTDTGFEYVELYNGAGRAVDLAGWVLQGGTSSFAAKVTLPADTVVPDGGFLVIGEDQVPERDVTAALALGNATSNADAVRLVDCNGAPMDTVVYGTPNEDLWVDDTGSVATSLAPKPTSGQALARRVDGADSDLSGDDFVSTGTLTPGGPNPAPPQCHASTGTIVINEFLANPVGADAGFEWVELYNAGPAAVRLDGWTFRTATSGANYSIKATLPDDTSLSAGGYFVIGEASVGEADFVSTLSMGNGTGGDGVRLVDCAGNTVDTVVYGDQVNPDEVVDDAEQPAVYVVPAPGDGLSLARKVNGVDTDNSYDDFAPGNPPTPGAPNPVLTCTPSTGTIKLNEFLSDPEGPDSTALAEWIELYNRGSGAVDVDGWWIVAAGSADDTRVDVVFPPASRLVAGGFFVVGGENVPEADHVATFSIGNGTNGDAIYLFDCTGELVDAVIYGSNNDDLLPDESGAVASPAPNPGSNRSLARRLDGVDTDSPADWFVDLTPTPGATNFQEVPIIDEDDPKGCRRRNQAPGNSDAPGGGCATLPLPFGGVELLPLLVAIRRRRPAR